MRWRVVALASLGANVVLAACWLSLSRRDADFRSVTAFLGTQPPTNPARTNLVVRRQIFSWQEIESDDYPAYIANLRDIGCPEQTIRDIIIADVNALYARRRATEILSPEQQWWRAQPDTNTVEAAIEKARELEKERRALLTRLLGTSWESGDLASLPRPTQPGLELDGPQLGPLPTETKQAVQDVNKKSTERMQAYLEAQAKTGKPPDPVELARLRKLTRDDLARVLGPGALEEFLLRYSQDAMDLRTEFGQLGYFDVSSNEFRTVFRATDTIDQQIQMLVGNDPNTLSQRNALAEARENALKIALGPKRYELYRDLQDPLFRQAYAQAVQAGTPELAATLYEISLAADSQQQDIRSNANLTADQKNIELKQLELDQLKANTLATGQELPAESPPNPPGLSPPKRTYVIHPGDNVAVVSMIYGVPVSALRQANPNLNLNRLRPGDALAIPPSQMPTPWAP
jgi:LysM domain